MRVRSQFVFGFMLIGLVSPAFSQESPDDNRLSAREEAEGWILLFDGQTLQGWITSDRKPGNRPVEEGAINPHRCGAYMLVHEKKWTDFVLKLDYKQSPKCNSGLFFKTHSLDPMPGKDVGYNGLEIAIDDTTTAGYVDTGAIYDLSKPVRNAQRPVGEWNHLTLTCSGSKVIVVLNGEGVNAIDLADFTEPGMRPDGTTHKFPFAYKDHPRSGYIGLQDHGADIWFKNIKLLPLND